MSTGKRVKYDWWPDLNAEPAKALLDWERQRFGDGWHYAGTRAELQAAGLWHPEFDVLLTGTQRQKQITTTRRRQAACHVLFGKTPRSGTRRTGRYRLILSTYDEWDFERFAPRRTLADCLAPPSDLQRANFALEEAWEQEYEKALAAQRIIAAFARRRGPF